MRQNEVKFTCKPTYYPASNGVSESFVQTAKVALTEQVLDGKASTLSLEHQLANFFILSRSTPHTITGQSAAQLFLGREIRNCFTLPKPNLNRAVEEKQVKQKEYHDEGRVKFREFKLNEVVLLRNWRSGIETWVLRRITQVKGPRTYLGCCGKQIHCVHVDHLKGTGSYSSLSSVAGGGENSRVEELVKSQAAEKDCLVLPEPHSIPETSAIAGNTEEQLVPKETQDSGLGDTLQGKSTPGLPLLPPSVSRYPRRERKAPSRFICEIYLAFRFRGKH